MGAQTIAALRQAHPDGAADRALRRRHGAEVRRSCAPAPPDSFRRSAISKVMLQAIRLVLAGGQYLPPQLMDAARSDGRVARSHRARHHARTADAARMQVASTLLSPRQREVFALLAKGLSNKMIARELDVTEGTVKSHVATIFDVLNVHNRVSAVAEAQRLSNDPEGRRLLGD